MSIARRAIRAWRILTWRHWAWASGAALLLSIASPLQRLDFNASWAIQSMYLRAPWYLAFAWLFLAALAWVEADHRGATTWRYLRGALAVGLVCLVASGLFAASVPMPPRTISQGFVLNPGPDVHADVRARAVAMSVVGMDAAFHGALAVLIYARLRRARLAALDLARAELARTESNRNLLALRLDAARAQIDPSLVIEHLERIEAAYETDPAAADVELDELIAFLRGAIPRLRAEPVPEMQA
jgi:hypothetical protein